MVNTVILVINLLCMACCFYILTISLKKKNISISPDLPTNEL